MTEGKEAKPIEILLVEDNPGDVRLTREALREGRVLHRMTVASDGEEALEILHRKGKHQDAPRPDIIFLDLNLPKKDGREVLADIKSDPDLAIIPVVILTTSNAETDILRSYQLHANCYITKPVDLIRFIEVVKNIEEFWFAVVVLPKSGEKQQQ